MPIVCACGFRCVGFLLFDSAFVWARIDNHMCLVSVRNGAMRTELPNNFFVVSHIPYELMSDVLKPRFMTKFLSINIGRYSVHTYAWFCFEQPCLFLLVQRPTWYETHLI